MIKSPQIFDMEECQKALAVFIIVDEQPFKIVDGYGFRNLLSRLQPLFHVPSYFTMAKDCYQLFWMRN